MNEKRYQAIISGAERSVTASLARGGLTVASLGYRSVVAARNLMFDLGLRRSHDLGRPAISIGNLTAGGTGKTPMVIEVACRLLNMGKRPAVLLRGYHAQDGLSDEARLLADALAPHVMVHAHPKRRIGAANALLANSNIDCFILDDAFQHRQAQRQLDIVLIDATNPFGHGRVLPRGLLRESPYGLRRAQCAVVTRADLVAPEMLDALLKQLAHLTDGQVKLSQVAFEWKGYRGPDDRTIDLQDLHDQCVLGVCGVGNPQAFTKMLTRQLGQQRVLTMDDHYAYTVDDLTSIFKQAEEIGAKAIITTEKDWVKWRLHVPAGGWPLPVYRPVLGVHWLAGEEIFEAMLQQFDHDTPEA